MNKRLEHREIFEKGYTILKDLIEIDPNINTSLIKQFIPNHVICDLRYEFAVKEYTEHYSFESNNDKIVAKYSYRNFENINIFPISHIFKNTQSLISTCDEYKLDILMWIDTDIDFGKNISFSSIQRDTSSYSIKYNMNDDISCSGGFIIYLSERISKDRFSNILTKISNDILSNINLSETMLDIDNDGYNMAEYKLSGILTKLSFLEPSLSVNNFCKNDSREIYFDVRCSFPRLHEKDNPRPAFRFSSSFDENDSCKLKIVKDYKNRFIR